MDRCKVFVVPGLAGSPTIPPKGGTTNGLIGTMQFPGERGGCAFKPRYIELKSAKTRLA